MDKEKFEKIAKMYFLEEKMKEIYLDMIEVAGEEHEEELVTICVSLFRIYNTCTEKLAEMKKNLVN